MSGIFKIFIPILVIVGLAAGALFFLKNGGWHADHVGAHSGEEMQLAIGASVKDFNLIPIDGGAAQSLSSFSGKVFLINFWATWCGSCVVEMPSIVKLQDKFRSQGLQVLFVSVDDDAPSVVKPVLENIGVSFPTYWDQGTVLGDLFDLHAVPLTVILDRNRKILYFEAGERDWFSTKVQGKIEEWLR